MLTLISRALVASLASIIVASSAVGAAVPTSDTPAVDRPTHDIAGELIAFDHINRTGTLRPDRTDAQRRGDWDLPLDFTLLPHGSLRYHGAPVALRDIPIGTHLHGQFIASDKAAVDPKAKTEPNPRRISADSKYDRVLLIEDDISYDARIHRTWRVETVTLDTGLLTLIASNDPKPVPLQIGSQTRVWKGRSLGTLDDLKPGQTPSVNITYSTVKGPGRCVDIWLDDEARALSTTLQREEHRRYIREHGLPGRIEAIDNIESLITVALFDGFDAALLGEFPTKDEVAKAVPFVPGPGLVDPIAITAAVAEDSLRTWDQINDRKSGPMLELIKAKPRGPGDSGVTVRFKPTVLIEGFRPQRIIRIWPSKWKVDDLPREEKLYE